MGHVVRRHDGAVMHVGDHADAQAVEGGRQSADRTSRVMRVIWRRSYATLYAATPASAAD